MSIKARRPVAAIAAAGLLLFGAGLALAQGTDAESCPIEGLWPARFASALSGDTFLTEEGGEVHLAGVLAPLSDENGWSAGLVETSRSNLVRAIGDRALSLAFTSEERDRYDRQIAQVFMDGEWLQGFLLRGGWVRAAPAIATQVCATALLEAEAQARSTGAGHWTNRDFAVLQLEQVMTNERRLAGSFQIVEGTIIDVGDFRGRYFLNFGEDRQTDFTVTIAPADMRNFRAVDFELESMEGRRVRVRGWLESYNGPNMPISIPGVIKVLD